MLLSDKAVACNIMAVNNHHHGQVEILLKGKFTIFTKLHGL